jgi:hypothetical protein
VFVAEELGDHELKGVPAPVTLYRIGRTSGGGRRAGQRHLTPLVGREEEIAMPHRPAIAAHPACSVFDEFHREKPDRPGTCAVVHVAIRPRVRKLVPPLRFGLDRGSRSV